MHPALALILIVLVGLACGAAVYYGVIYGRVRSSARRVPTVRDGLGMPPPEAGWPRVCVVVPAHNEERVIEPLVRSLVAQEYPALRLVFSLDRCTDGTEAVIRRAAEASVGGLDPRVEIVRVESCPEGWAGKTHAAWRGVRDSAGARGADLLLFADADTVFDPLLVRAAVALLHARGLDLLSLLSELVCEDWYELLVQPAAAFELVRQYPLDVVNRAVRPRAFANGQFMLFCRSFYDRFGGHERVKGELLEDIALARLINKERKRLGGRWGVFMPAGMLRCRMYRSWDAFRRGWKRIYAEATRRRPAQLREWAWRNRFVGTVLPLAPLACLAVGAALLAGEHAGAGWAVSAAGGVSLLIVALALSRLYRDQGLSRWRAATYPLGAWFVASLLAEAARDLDAGVATRWGGREYAREVRA